MQKFKYRHPILFLFLLWIVLPVVLVVACILYWLHSGLPQQHQVVNYQGLSQPVTVIRDELGVPTISAKTDLDAFSVMGFVHAQDRLWQMEYKRRLAQGRLSEVFGKSTLDTDRYMRTLGLYDSARQSIEHLPQPAVAVLRAYSLGVNRWIEKSSALPIEYMISGFSPEPWSITDSLVQIKIMALNLGANYQDELTNQILIGQLGVDKFATLNQQDTTTPVVNSLSGENWINAFASVLHTSQNVFEQEKLGGEAVGSNAWVVSGEHSQSGSPILANDPHLQHSLPTSFYIAHLKGDVLDVKGATIAGLPVVIFGQNKSISWGGTNLAADVQDLYIEQLNTSNNNQYEVDEQWRTMSFQHEKILVARDFPSMLQPEFKPVDWVVRKTEHGPLISDATANSSVALSLRWTALDVDDTTFSGFLDINYAQNWHEFRRALSQHVAPALGFVYADTKNNIGFSAAGRIPVRSSGDGTLPLKGKHSELQWQSYVPFSALPNQYNPRSGILVTANHRIHSPDYPHIISNNWRPGYRAQRIHQQIAQWRESDVKLTSDHFIQLQHDALDLQALELLPFLMSLQSRTPEQQAMLAQLSLWDGEMSGERPAAVIFRVWLRYFYAKVVHDELHQDVTTANRTHVLSREENHIRPIFLRAVLTGNAESWCDDVSTESTETCKEIAIMALDDVYKEIYKLQGGDIDDWNWPSLLNAQFTHQPFGNKALMGTIFDRSQSTFGSQYTVNVAGNYYEKGEGYIKHLGATYRQVIDMSKLSHSYMTIDLGQSGNILSEYYDNFLSKQGEGQ
ncbi:hypothetical protein N480_19180 [Pseudoalteromonas luteoviolacea S2607]|uniref:penicillin acylase family protein n=1 Tax=Pseudoalteromonas luteoviolacea TaxID=43657 RepID=UPI0007B05C18|nr:penicillin acylase family protein [Pseudoalteromonas luteoviolacea]KZN35309.1 hypothetical protein N480_19180 [Pseudoalteromonas luteoviolacea S2607]